MKKHNESKEKSLKRTTIILEQDLIDFLKKTSRSQIFNYSWQVLMRDILNQAIKDERFMKNLISQKVENIKKVLNSI